MTRANIEAIYPLAPVQEGILYHTLEQAGSDVYLVQFSCRLDHLHDPERWQSSWQNCVDRHPALRTLFTWEKREYPLQIVRHQVDVPWQLVDLRELAEPEQEQRFQSLCELDRSRVFDLSQAPLFRFTLVRIGESRYQFLWTFHHILLDGWSQQLLLREALATYRGSNSSGRDSAAARPPPYEDFVNWLESRDRQAEQDFWRGRLADFHQPCLLAGVLQQPAEAATATGAAVEELSLDEELYERLSQSAIASRVTLNTVMVAAWALVVGTNCRRDDVLFGTTVSGRPAELPGAGEIAGLCINTLPMRLSIPARGGVNDWLRTVQSAQMEARAFENASLTEIQKYSGVEPGRPLFDNILVFENLPDATADESPGDQPGVSQSLFKEFSHYPLAMLVEPSDGLKLVAVYRREQLPGEAVVALLQQLVLVLEQLSKAGSLRLEEITLLRPAQQRMIEQQWNDSPVVDQPCAFVHRLVERTARRCPSQIALVDTQLQLTFEEFNGAANRLAWHLIERGLQPSSMVVVFMERGAQAIVSFLAVLKAGGVYIPLDSDTPPARLAAILDELSPHQPLVMSQSRLTAGLPEAGVSLLCLDSERLDIEARDTHNPDVELSPDQLAYVIYTSGSTGMPKGVMIEHRNLVSSTQARLDYYPEQPGSFLLISSLAVDSSVAGIYWCLCRGATLVIAENRLEQDPDRLGRLIERQAVTHLLCIPSLYQLLLEHIPAEMLYSLRTVIVAGEACMPGLVESHRKLLPDTRLYNEYGPSECTVWATVSDLETWNPGHRVPIGRPVANTIAYILDNRGHSVPAGVAGELYIGGDALARGYLDATEATNRAFLAMDELLRPRAFRDLRLYRTGDLARYRADGEIEFLGRVDNQLKVRGHRVEPEEIEQVLARHPHVREAAVFLDVPHSWTDYSLPGSNPAAPADRRKLIACVTLAAESSAEAPEILEYARAHLPRYMVPHSIRHVLDLPREPGGKIARGALPTYQWKEAAPQRISLEPPPSALSEEEKTLLAIWREVLDVESLDVHSNFFELGGDSLLSIRVLSRARKAGLDISSDDFFAEPTVAGQARLAGRAIPIAEVAEDPGRELALSPIQCWFFEHNRSHEEQWNQSLLLRLQPPLDFPSLERSLASLLDHHEALRTVFENTGGSWRPRILQSLPDFPLDRVRLSGLAAGELDGAIQREATAIDRAFDLVRGPLARFLYIETDPDLDDRLLICVHHLLIDVESWSILLAELESLWGDCSAGREPQPAERSSSHRNWLAHIRGYASSAELSGEFLFWKSIVDADFARLPLDMVDRGAGNTNASEQQVSVSLGETETGDLLLKLPRGYNSDLFDALVTCLFLALKDWTGGDQMRVDLEGHGRERLFPAIDTTHTVGWFTSLYPILFRRYPGESVVDSLVRVKEMVRSIPNKGIGFGILRYLGDSSRHRECLAQTDRAQVCLNYLGQLDRLQSREGLLSIERENVGEPRAPAGMRMYELEVNCRVSGGKLAISIHYSSTLHHRSTIEGIADAYLHYLRSLAAACGKNESRVHTPSDFPLANLGQNELDRIGSLLADSDEGTGL